MPAHCTSYTEDMQCPIVEGTVTLKNNRYRYRGNVTLKNNNNLKNCTQEYNLEDVVDYLGMRFKDIKERERTIGMLARCLEEEKEAVQRYYAAFPALKKANQSPMPYRPPPPAWCRKIDIVPKVKMQSELSMSKDWNSKKKYCAGKERRNPAHGHKKNNKRRRNSYGRIGDSEESLPEWMTHEGVWDMETQDPVKEFIRAIALDEGYGTCENTLADEPAPPPAPHPPWDDGLHLDAEWIRIEDLDPRARSPLEEELYAKFEAKFDRSIEALWSKDQNTPDDEYQDLPIDFQDLLSSPSDHLFDDTSRQCSWITLNDSIWSTEARVSAESPTNAIEGLYNRLRPLKIDDPPGPRERASAFYKCGGLCDALTTAAYTMNSYITLNHSRDCSGFAEVPPRRHRSGVPFPDSEPPQPAPLPPPREDLLTSTRTHFRPIRREDAEPIRSYADGDTFDIRGDLDVIEFERSASGGVYLGGAERRERYLEYRAGRTIDYARLNLTPAQRCPDLDDPAFRLRFPLRQCDAGTQTMPAPPPTWECDECGGRAKKMRAVNSIWSETYACECDSLPSAECGRGRALNGDEMSREWEELLEDISAAHRLYAGEVGEGEEGPGDRKRRHSAALRCVPPCSRPQARFLHCCAAALHRPLTR